MGVFGRKATQWWMMGAFAAAAWPCDLSIPAAEIAPGGTLSMPLVLAPNNGAVTGVQFDLQYDPNVLALSFVPGDASRAAAKTIYSSESISGARRFLIVGLNANPIEGTDLVRLFVTVLPDAAAGTYEIGIAEPACVDFEGGALAAGARPTPISVQGAPADTGLASDGVLNAASLLPGPVSPGELVSILGNGLIAPDDSPSTVYFGDLQAQVLYQSPSQLNVLVPEGVTETQTIMRVHAGNTLRGQMDLSVAEMAPAIFTQDSSGIGSAVALNEDGSLNGPLNPAAKGSVLTVFVTGVRFNESQPLNGAPAGEPVGDVVVAGMRVPVLSITRSGDIPGVFAAQFQIPPEATSSGSSALVLRAGQFATQAGVAIAIQ
jgi:uncharacterized protein (TIGR03437 family)